MKSLPIIIATLLICLCMPSRTFAFTVSGVELQNIALISLENALAERGETRRHEIIFSQFIGDIKVPDGTIDVKAQIAAQISYLSLTPVRLIVFVDERHYRTISLTAKVQVFDSVLVANHDLRIEVPVSASDFHTAEIVIDGRNDFIKDINDISGLVPHRFIRAGSPVTKAYFQQPVAVNSGQRVNIILNHHGIKIAAKGIVLARARIGELVKVKNESSEKILTARVLDSNTVEVSL